MTTDNTLNTTPQNPSGTQKSGIAKLVGAGALIAAGVGGLWYQGSQLNTVRQELAQTQSSTQMKLEQLNGQFQASTEASRAAADENIAKMNQQVEKARREAQASSQRASASAKQQVGEVMNTMTAKNQELVSQVDQLKQDGAKLAEENAQKSAKFDESLVGIKDDVGTVKTDVASTRTELANTITDLRRATGDMGVMSGLIATNSTELSALRRLGERDYIQFTLPKKNGTQKIGDIQMTLKKADPKKNKFTVAVLADDKLVEKKDKGLNEPVQFYTGSSRIPYEVVINKITKDTIVGYLAVPKVKIV
ncbi:MAG: hypothetical protein ABI824_17850, partial [Acidobacteriota bacterium]